MGIRYFLKLYILLSLVIFPMFAVAKKVAIIIDAGDPTGMLTEAFTRDARSFQKYYSDLGYEVHYIHPAQLKHDTTVPDEFNSIVGNLGGTDRLTISIFSHGIPDARSFATVDLSHAEENLNPWRKLQFYLTDYRKIKGKYYWHRYYSTDKHEALESQYTFSEGKSVGFYIDNGKDINQRKPFDHSYFLGTGEIYKSVQRFLRKNRSADVIINALPCFSGLLAKTFRYAPRVEVLASVVGSSPALALGLNSDPGKIIREKGMEEYIRIVESKKDLSAGERTKLALESNYLHTITDEQIKSLSRGLSPIEAFYSASRNHALNRFKSIASSALGISSASTGDKDQYSPPTMASLEYVFEWCDQEQESKAEKQSEKRVKILDSLQSFEETIVLPENFSNAICSGVVNGQGYHQRKSLRYYNLHRFVVERSENVSESVLNSKINNFNPEIIFKGYDEKYVILSRQILDLLRPLTFVERKTQIQNLSERYVRWELEDGGHLARTVYPLVLTFLVVDKSREQEIFGFSVSDGDFESNHSKYRISAAHFKCMGEGLRKTLDIENFRACVQEDLKESPYILAQEVFDHSSRNICEDLKKYEDYLDFRSRCISRFTSFADDEKIEHISKKLSILNKKD